MTNFDYNRFILIKLISLILLFSFNDSVRNFILKLVSIFFISEQVESSDRSALNKVVETVKTNFNERADEIKKHWGGSSLGNKSSAKLAKVQKAKDKEAAKL